MANVIPMAGLGSRFSKEGYTTPKPLINVSGVPMIVQAIRHMPPSHKWIFLVRQEHIRDHKIDEVITKELPNAIIVAVNQTTLGQANTSLLAQAYLHPDEPVFIAACDNGYVYNKEKYAELTNDPNIDCVVWTFTQMEKMRASPHSYGWVVLEKDQKTISDMSVKVPISDNPYNDHAVVATFSFKRAKDFIAAVNLMIEQNHKINNEFYVDAVPIFLKKLGKTSVIMDVDQWVCWGTPKELQEYEHWEKVFKHDQAGDQNDPKYSFWQRYFT
jgi:NDP-sugar pyrophosphorylase family protein